MSLLIQAIFQDKASKFYTCIKAHVTNTQNNNNNRFILYSAVSLLDRLKALAQ